MPLSCLLPKGLLACLLGLALLPASLVRATETRPLKDLYTGMRIGCTVTYGGLSYEGVFNSPTKDTFIKLFQQEFNLGQTTCYPAWDTWTGVKSYDFTKVNQTVNWLYSRKYPIAMHLLGGPDSYYPTWFASATYTTTQLEDMLEDFIRVAMTTNDNATKITYWNVVNECLDLNARYYPAGGSISCQWLNLGYEADKSGLTGTAAPNATHPVWIRKAFEFAKKYAKPGNKLELRDYNIEIWDKYKSKAFYQLVRHLLNSGTPLDAIGLQGHFDIGTSYDWTKLSRTIQEYRNLGLEVYITELDVGDTAKSWTETKSQTQKAYYKAILQAAAEGGVSWVCTWGMHDQSSLYWRYDQMALMFDTNYAPKPAYYGVQEGLSPASGTKAPSISTHPLSTTIAPGNPVTLTSSARGQTPLSYQWYKDGIAIAGAQADSYALSSADTADTGHYTVTVSNAGGSVSTRYAKLVVAPLEDSRIINVAIRGKAGLSGNPLILGFVVSGSSAKQVLVRGSGPALIPLGVSDVLADPHLTVYEGSNSIGYNDDWSSGAERPSLLALFNKTGASPFADPSKDAAIAVPALDARTIHVNGKDNASGVVLVEAYDAHGGEPARLVNVSARNFCGLNDDVLIAGFVINGTVPKKILIRGIGPGLSLFNIDTRLADPSLELHTRINDNDVVVAANDDWSAQDNSREIAGIEGPFAIPVGSKDSALLLTLSPGAYSAIVRGNNSTTGEALVEVYEINSAK